MLELTELTGVELGLEDFFELVTKLDALLETAAKLDDELFDCVLLGAELTTAGAEELSSTIICVELDEAATAGV